MTFSQQPGFRPVSTDLDPNLIEHTKIITEMAEYVECKTLGSLKNICFRRINWFYWVILIYGIPNVKSRIWDDVIIPYVFCTLTDLGCSVGFFKDLTIAKYVSILEPMPPLLPVTNYSLHFNDVVESDVPELIFTCTFPGIVDEEQS